MAPDTPQKLRMDGVLTNALGTPPRRLSRNSKCYSIDCCIPGGHIASRYNSRYIPIIVNASSFVCPFESLEDLETVLAVRHTISLNVVDGNYGTLYGSDIELIKKSPFSSTGPRDREQIWQPAPPDKPIPSDTGKGLGPTPLSLRRQNTVSTESCGDSNPDSWEETISSHVHTVGCSANICPLKAMEAMDT